MIDAREVGGPEGELAEVLGGVIGDLFQNVPARSSVGSPGCTITAGRVCFSRGDIWQL
jgi:hypothetical protein